jgi:hypothetical protein
MPNRSTGNNYNQRRLTTESLRGRTVELRGEVELLVERLFAFRYERMCNWNNYTRYLIERQDHPTLPLQGMYQRVEARYLEKEKFLLRIIARLLPNSFTTWPLFSDSFYYVD